MKTDAKQGTSTAKLVVGSWITWVALGAAAGAGVFFSTGLGASDGSEASAPSGTAIEAAVSQAEAEGNAARVAQEGQ